MNAAPYSVLYVVNVPYFVVKWKQYRKSVTALLYTFL